MEVDNSFLFTMTLRDTLQYSSAWVLFHFRPTKLFLKCSNYYMHQWKGHDALFIFNKCKIGVNPSSLYADYTDFVVQ